MLEAKEGDLETSPVKKVISRKQAFAIALREAGASSQETPRRPSRYFASAKTRQPFAVGNAEGAKSVGSGRSGSGRGIYE